LLRGRLMSSLEPTAGDRSQICAAVLFMHAWLQALSVARIMVAWTSTGIAMGVYDACLRYGLTSLVWKIGGAG
jgi:hypothetical protein